MKFRGQKLKFDISQQAFLNIKTFMMQVFLIMNYMQLKLIHRHLNDELLYVKRTFWTELFSSSEAHIVTEVPPNSSMGTKSTAT